MSTVQQFNLNTLEEYLKETDHNYLKDKEGDFHINYQYDEEMGCGLKVLLEARGEKKEIYIMLMISDKPIPKSEWGKTLLICNEWNQNRLWPKAYLQVEDPDVDSTGTIVTEQSLDLEKGIHKELLSYLTEEMIYGAYQFFKWAHEEKGLYQF